MSSHPRSDHAPRRRAGIAWFTGLALALITLGLSGCGANTGAAEVRIASDDQMRFDIDEFTVHAGQPVRLTLEHTGEMGVEQMGHNVVILNADEDPVAFGSEVGQQGGKLENNHLPESMRDRVIAYTRVIGGGESDTIEFNAPEQAGEYPFVCTFPGHSAVMRGVMVIRG